VRGGGGGGGVDWVGRGRAHRIGGARASWRRWSTCEGEGEPLVAVCRWPAVRTGGAFSGNVGYCGGSTSTGLRGRPSAARWSASTGSRTHEGEVDAGGNPPLSARAVGPLGVAADGDVEAFFASRVLIKAPLSLSTSVVDLSFVPLTLFNHFI
jgi:hypothetical protein